ncbi:MAG: hypothetical protein A3F42_03055 [Gammaproteobacteria bacterium RIFCSPHIGHO2_12_FULL_37_34]|nr:MAG: hypothetical protein A3F42_03055 [Gammaproteobacteria bacterium RIFCSPHIGHO2_12_FULL_37_34]
MRLLNGSGVKREVPAPFCERLELRCSGLLTCAKRLQDQKKFYTIRITKSWKILGKHVLNF